MRERKSIGTSWMSETLERMDRVLNPMNQPWLMSRMQELGYGHLSKDGVCFGVATLGVQAVLTDNLDKFNQRLKKMREIPVDKFAETVHAGRRHKDREMINILAFCEDVDLCHLPVYATAHLVQSKEIKEQKEQKGKKGKKEPPEVIKKSQNEMITLGIIKSVQLEKTGIQQVAKYSSPYNMMYLQAYFHNLNEKVKGLTQPVAFFLNSGNHGVTVGFNPNNKKSWSIIDANKLPVESFDYFIEVANAVGKAFTMEEDLRANAKVIFSTTVYTTDAQAEMLTKKFEDKDGMIYDYEEDKKNSKLVDDTGNAWLIRAVADEDIALVTSLLERKADPNKKSSGNLSPLFMAAQIGNDTLVKILLARGANADAEGQDKQTVLHAAASSGQLEVVKTILEHKSFFHKAKIDAPSAGGVTPFGYAALFGYPDVMRELLKHRASPSKADKEGITPLQYACLGENYAGVQLILDLKDPKVNLSHKDSKGMNVVHAAALGGNVDILKTVLPLVSESNINATMSLPKEKVLVKAAKLGRTNEVIKLFGVHGKQYIPATIGGLTPLGCAVIFGNVLATRLLLEQGANVNILPGGGVVSDLVQVAEAFGHTHIASMLKAHKAPTMFQHQKEASVQTVEDKKSLRPEGRG